MSKQEYCVLSLRSYLKHAKKPLNETPSSGLFKDEMKGRNVCVCCDIEENMRVVALFVATMLVAWPWQQCHGIEYSSFPLQMKTGSGVEDVSCASWRLGVEAHNLINWRTVPQQCQEYVASYLLDGQYRSDSKTVCREAFLYAKTLNITTKDIFIFDVDDTLLSNLPYFANHGFGVEPHNKTAFSNWVASGDAFALPETLKLYSKILSLGIKVVFLSERRLDQRDVLVKNLKDAGFPTWEKLIVRDPASFGGDETFAYKSAERVKLVRSGYIIVGNIGDQWSDISESHRSPSMYLATQSAHSEGTIFRLMWLCASTATLQLGHHASGGYDAMYPSDTISRGYDHILSHRTGMLLKS
ncbi:hypothetical protein Fmac_012462 [Flemingia macrophylla]|uniref:Stem 28 kDa glycoprotein n=1 Tax=Flemingia macrophylla TaxID=520843 RepID=A0ABD1MQD6_9FABA